MRDNRFNGVGGGMNRRIGCVLIFFFGLTGYLFQSLGCISFVLDLLVREVNLSGWMKYFSYCTVVEYIIPVFLVPKCWKSAFHWHRPCWHSVVGGKQG